MVGSAASKSKFFADLYLLATARIQAGPILNWPPRRLTRAGLTSLAALLLALAGAANASAFNSSSEVASSGQRTALSFVASTGRHGANHFLLRRAGAKLQLLDMDTGALLRDVALAHTSRVAITGASGRVDNTLTLDFSGGPIDVPGGISYAGGRGGYNVLALRGGRFAHEREVPYTPHSGLIVLDRTTIHYAEIAPINDTTAAASLTINATAAAETINVGNGPVLAGTQTTQVASSNKAFELVNFANKTSVTVNGGGGSDTFDLNVTTPAVGLGSMTLASSERESSTFDVTAITVPLSLVGGGTDTANIGTATAQTITSTVSISDPAEFIAVNIDDAGNTSSSRFVTVSSGSAIDTISGLTPSSVTVTAGDLASLTLDGGSVGNTFVINGPAGPGGRTMPITVNTGTGTDSTFIQNIASGSSIAVHGQNGSDGVSISNAGTLQGILGPVSIDNAGAFTSVVIDDSNDATGRSASLTSDGTTDTIAGFAPANITARVSDMAGFTLDGGAGGNTLALAGFGDPGTTTLNTGTGPDTTSVQPTSSLGVLNINGQAGSDTVNLGSAGSVQELTKEVNVTNGATTTLRVEDTSDVTARASVLGTTQLTGLSPGAINYSGVSALSVEGGAPSDTFAVTPSATMTDDIIGGGAASAAPPGNTLNMNLTGVTSPSLGGTPTAAGAQGTWTFANRSPVSFSHMQSLNPTAVSVGDAATTVTGSGSSPLLFGVTLLAPSAFPVSATYATADGSATVASGAYQPASGTVFFPAGATSETVLVSALGTPIVRSPQTLTLALLEPVNALLARSMATGTITDSFNPAALPGQTSTTPPAVTPAPASVAPVLSHLTQTRASWRLGRALAVVSGAARRRAPIGTSFSFSLSEAAGVTFAFGQGVPGRRSGRRCVAQTKKNRAGRPCQRVLTRGMLTVVGHVGVNHVSFQGRFSSNGTLKVGRYVLSVTAANAAGQHSSSSSLAFAIVK